MRTLTAGILDALTSQDLTWSLALILGGTGGFATRRSANGLNMPRAQELSVEGVTLQGDSLIEVPPLTEDGELSAPLLEVTISPPNNALDSIAAYRSSPPDASAPPQTAELYLLIGDATSYTVAGETALLIWAGTVSGHTYGGADSRLTLRLEPAWARLARTPGLRYDPQDQRRLFAGDTGLDHAPATRRALALSAGTATPVTPDDPALLATPPRRLIYGRRQVTGDIVLAAISGAGSRYLNLVVALASHEVSAIERIWLDGREIEFTTGDTVGGNFAGKVTVARKLGTSGQTVDTALQTELGTTLWPNTSRLRGIAHIVLRLQWATGFWEDGIPVVTALVKGKLCTDPRDTGAAAAWSDNPAVQLYDYLLDATHGPGLPSARLDTESFAAAASACAEAVELASGLTEPRYTAHLTADHTESRDAIILRLLSTMGGALVTAGTGLRLLAGTWRAPEAALTSADLLDWWREETQEAALRPNTARGTYVSAPNYFTLGYPAQALADWVTAEGEQPTTLDFPAVTSPTQAQRLARLALQRGRRRLRATAQLPAAGYRLAVGDTVTVQLPGQQYGAMDPVTMEITSLQLRLTGYPATTLQLVETAEADYAWETTDEGTLVTPPGTLTLDLNAWRAATLTAPALDTPSQTFGTAGSGYITVDVATVGEPGATVYFTTDGSDPTTSSTAWGGSPRTYTATTTLKIRAELSGLYSQIVTYTYTLAAPAAITVTVTTSGGGTVSGDGAKTEGDTVTLTATGNTGKGFIRWSGAYRSERNPLVFTAGAVDVDLIASFGDKLLTPLDAGSRIQFAPDGVTRQLIQRITNPSGQPISVRYSSDGGATFTSQIATLAPGKYIELVMRSGLTWSAFTAEYQFADGSTLTRGQSDKLSISYAAYP